VGLILERIGNRRVYLDTNIFIYALEDTSFTPLLADLFTAIDDYKLEAVTSELSLAETLVKPIRERNIALRALFESRVETAGGLTVVPVDRSVLVRAAELRAQTVKLRLPDAIHIATALDANCQMLLSNDSRLDTPVLDLLLLSTLAES
jgi:predicted nucleic acid-binding protein